MALRVPITCGSIVDFTALLKKNTDAKNVNNAFKEAAKKELKGVLDYTEDEIVSSDIIGTNFSSIVDGLSTQMIGNNFVKVLAWYDNEYGYSNRMVDVIKMLR